MQSCLCLRDCNNDYVYFKVLSYLTASCSDGNLRLMGGDSEYEGILEICFGQRWGTVNGDGWTSTDTQVACRQLGFETTGEYIRKLRLYKYK